MIEDTNSRFLSLMQNSRNCFLSVALLAASQVAHGELISFNYAGTFDSSISGTSLDAGDGFFGSFVLDTLSPISQQSASTERYDNAISAAVFSLDGVTPVPFGGTPQFFVTTSGSAAAQLAIRFNFDGAVAPFNGAGSGTIGRFEVIYNATGILGSGLSFNLSTLDAALLATLSPNSARVLVFGDGDSDISFTDASTDMVVVPEPGTLGLLGAGLLGLGFMRRRQAA